MKTKHLITDWRAWEELCMNWEIDPHKVVEHGEDSGGGDSFFWEYTGDVPEKEDIHQEHNDAPLEGFAKEGASEDEGRNK